MNCCKIHKDTVSFTFSVDELKMQVKQTAHALSANAKDDNGVPTKAWVADILECINGDSTKVELPYRYMSLAVSAIANCLSGLGFKTKGNKVYDNNYNEKDTFVISVEKPEGLHQSTADYIEQLANDYIVTFTLFKWCALLDKDTASLMYEQCSECIKNIKLAVANMDTICFRKLYPF